MRPLAILNALLALVLLFIGACTADDEASPDDLKHNCRAAGDSCYCSAYWNGPGPTEPQIECSPETFSGTKCCATAGWPKLGPNNASSSCTCKSTDACGSSETEVASCKIDEPPPSTSSSSSSSSSGSTTCTGCQSDSDCHDKCKRCVRSTCSCVQRTTC